MAAPTDQSPLRGLSVVVTRPVAQSDFLDQQLCKLGAKSILFPCIETVQLDCKLAIEALPIRLEEFDIFIFVSRNAVQFSVTQIPQLIDLFSTGIKFAAVGLSTAKELQKLGIKQVLSPQQEFDSDALQALPELQN